MSEKWCLSYTNLEKLGQSHEVDTHWKLHFVEVLASTHSIWPIFWNQPHTHTQLEITG